MLIMDQYSYWRCISEEQFFSDTGDLKSYATRLAAVGFVLNNFVFYC